MINTSTIIIIVVAYVAGLSTKWIVHTLWSQAKRDVKRSKWTKRMRAQAHKVVSKSRVVGGKVTWGQLLGSGAGDVGRQTPWRQETVSVDEHRESMRQAMIDEAQRIDRLDVVDDAVAEVSPYDVLATDRAKWATTP